MNCEEIRNLLPAYAFGTATADEIKSVEDHLAGCGQHEEVAALKASVALIASSPRTVEPPAALKERIMAHIREQSVDSSPEPGPRRQQWFVRTLAANPITVVLVVFLVVMGAWNVTL